MKPEDMDALVEIVKQAIDAKFAQFKKDFAAEQFRSLVSVAKNAVRTDAEQIQAHLTNRLDEALKAIKLPEDGKDATGEQIALAVSEHMKLHPVIAPEPVNPTPEQISKSVQDYMQANPVPVPLAVAPTAEQVGLEVAKYMQVNPVIAPEPVEPTEEQITLAVQKHMQANPVPVVEPLSPTPDQIKSAVTQHFELNPVAAPEPLSPTDEQISKAVDAHMQANPLEIPLDSVDELVTKYLQANPVPVPEAPEAIKPTEAEISEAVAKHLTANPPQRGSPGLDAMEINILPRIDPDRSYAKGTYASYAGGLLKALTDTVPGPDPLSQGWVVVIEGVAAAEVHQLDDGAVAVKTVLTGGASHIVKLDLPTMTYKGVWKESHGEYLKGHTVTQNGSLWHCNQKTTDKPGTSDAWTLCAKRGVDGKDVNVVKMRPGTYSIKGDK